MSVGLYSHTTRGTGTTLTAAIYNSDHENHVTNQNPSMTGAYSDNITQMQTVADPGGLGSENLAASLAGELERLRYVISRIIGKTHWYEDPTLNIEEIDAAIVGGMIQQLIVTNTITPPEITSNQNNYAPTGHATAFAFRLSAQDDGTTITGLAGGVAGRMVLLQNVGDTVIVLDDESGDSTAANRFASSIALYQHDAALLRYDGTLSRWVRAYNSSFEEAVANQLYARLHLDVLNNDSPGTPEEGWWRYVVTGDYPTFIASDGSEVFPWAAASRAQMEAPANEDSHTITPSDMHFHPGHPKAGANFNGQGSPAFRQDYGMSAITDQGTGEYLLEFDTAFADTNYWLSGWCRSTNDNQAAAFSAASSGSKTASGIEVITAIASGSAAYTDNSEIGVSFWGTHA